MGMLHKEWRSVVQRARDHIGNFTQVRAAVRRKTLLPLWWIDSGKGGGGRNALCPAGLPQAKWLRVYKYVRA